MKAHAGVAALLLSACSTAKYHVPDSDFFTDGYMLDKTTLQLIESHEDGTLILPAAERHQRNCAAAEEKARQRFRAQYPQAKDAGIRLSSRFDPNAGCTVRMAFRKE